QTQTFVNGQINPELTPDPINGKVEIEVFEGITLAVNTLGAPEMFKEIDAFLEKASTTLGTGTGSEIGDLLGSNANGNNTLADMQAKVLDVRADVGARMNRVELMKNRLDIQEINIT